MRAGLAMWFTMVPVACGGSGDGGGDGDDGGADDSGAPPEQGLCDDFPNFPINAGDCRGIETALDAFLDESSFCERDADCRLLNTTSLCNISLIGAREISVNECFPNSLVGELASAYASCDDAGQSNCVTNWPNFEAACIDNACDFREVP